jgi:type VI protein secretion system component VasF
VSLKKLGLLSSQSPQGIRRRKGVKRSMPVIVIVLMFLVAFLLAVLAMLVAPLLGVGYALWNRDSQNLAENPVSAFNNSRYRSK